MDLSQIFALSSVGLLAGISSGLFGIGGGIIIVPLLIHLFQFEQRTASATSLLSMLLPVGILGVLSYYKAGVINQTHIRMGLIISVGLLLGGLFGSRLSLLLPTKIITKGFSLLLIYVAIRLWAQSNK